ncbi:MAG: class I SAM-dependent methyltransferase [Pseudomonadota bacterium]
MTSDIAQRERYTTANRAAWDHSAQFHRDNALGKELYDGFAEPGYSCLDDVETALLENIGVAGRDVVQICCNNGRELLSVKNMGAARCVGFDQSEPFLEQGRELARLAGQEIELNARDVYAIEADWDHSFDVALITIGVFGWMPDLEAFFDLPARLLRPGGHLVIHEEHPVMNMFEPACDKPFEPSYDYFRSAPFEDEGAIVYDGTGTGEGGTHYWFFHTLSDVMTAMLGAGFTIETFREYPNNISAVEFDIYHQRATNMPVSYVLVGKR